MGEPTRLAAEQLRALALLSGTPGIGRFHLAGGSAIAHHLGHRLSRDLDLFTTDRDLDLESMKDALREGTTGARVLGISDATLRIVVSGVPVDLVLYPYPLLEPAVPGPAGFPVAGMRDLAAMKLAAIARRGIRRDFWDIHAILGSRLSMKEAGSAYLLRFGLSEPDLYHVARALCWFDDAERDPVMPAGMTAVLWAEVKARVAAEAAKLLDAPG